jgi:putative spermidine/putrescine transport system permease protein
MIKYGDEKHTWLNLLPYSLMVLAILVVILPQIIVFITSFNSTPELAFPPNGLSIKWYINMIKREAFVTSMKLSVLLGALSTFLSLLLGFFFSLAIVRYRFLGRNLINTLVLSPLMIPEVVTGIALLYLFNKLQMYNTLINLLILHVLLTLPYSVRVISARLYRFDISLEEVAMSLGASRIKTFFLITIPLIRTGLMVAAIFSFVISFNNFTATMFLVTHKNTLPVEIFSYIRTENDPTVAAIASVFIIITIVLILFTEKIMNIGKVMQ